MLRKSLLVASIAFASLGVHAEQLYLGASVGQATYEDDGMADVDESTGFSMILGYQASPNFALEAAYVDFGSADFEHDLVTGEVEASTIALSGRVIAPLGEKASVYARVGMHKWDGEGTVHAFGSRDYEGNGMLYGAGLSFKPGQSIEFGLEFTKYEDVDVDTVNAAIRFLF